MRALIIGGTGFIGSNLAEILINNDYQVGALDKVPDRLNLYGENFYLGDSQNPELVQRVLQSFNPNIVYHLAANSDIQSGVMDASLDFGDTLMTTIALRQSLSHSNVEQLVFASSSAIFGFSQNAISEISATPEMPLSWYGKAKLASEYVLESLSAEAESPKILIVRFPNVVGPLATHGVIFDFINKLRVNPQHLQVLGDGNQKKPYVHVSDLIEGIEFFRARQNLSLERINIGPKDTSTVKFIANQVSLAMNLSPEISYQDTEYGWIGDVPKYSFDTTAMNSAGFRILSTSDEAVIKAAKELAESV